eukprot:763150-Hanusia_phi.AAC.1
MIVASGVSPQGRRRRPGPGPAPTRPWVGLAGPRGRRRRFYGDLKHRYSLISTDCNVVLPIICTTIPPHVCQGESCEKRGGSVYHGGAQRLHEHSRGPQRGIKVEG